MKPVFASFFLPGLALAICLFGLAACGNDTSSVDDPVGAEPPRIAPTDFVIAPCNGPASDAFCAIVAAGGKRVIIGAPSGIRDGRIAGEMTLPDAVLLPSLHPSNVEGLDELRNHTWTAGRRSPLKVIGPLGTSEFADSLNTAYTFPDAMVFLDTPNDDRDFAAMPIAGRDVGLGDAAFDTGDLVVTSHHAGNGRIAFLAKYDNRAALILPCQADPQSVDILDDSGLTIMACSGIDYGVAADIFWPTTELIYLNGPAAQ
ncbi:MAG: hypothetical protein AAF292_02075 [Pseudomonadota bacterium]